MPLINKTIDELMETEPVLYTKVLPFVDMVMTAHIRSPKIETETYQSLTGGQIYVPATFPKIIICGIFHGRLGYDGVVFIDAMEKDAFF